MYCSLMQCSINWYGGDDEFWKIDKNDHSKVAWPPANKLNEIIHVELHYSINLGIYPVLIQVQRTLERI